MTEGGDEAREPSREEILENSPEAVAMRRTREVRAERAAREAEARARPPAPGATRRKLVLGAVLGGVAAARALSRVATGRRGR